MPRVRILFVFTSALLILIPQLASAFSTSGFQNPYGIAVDPKSGNIYVSNVNGAMDGRDDNGFISRLKPDGSVDQLHFIDGVSKELTLHAPKGMAISGTTLYVCDIEKLHAFDVEKGKLLFDVNFGDLPVIHFYDIASGPDDALYITEGPNNIVYRIAISRLHEVTTLAYGDWLGNPRGITWVNARQVFAVAGGASGKITIVDRLGRQQPTPTVALRTIEEIDADTTGNLYVAAPQLQAVFRLPPNFAITSFNLGLSAATGVAFHKPSNQIIMTSFDKGEVVSLPVATGQ